jgi:hypothetical protein
MMGIISEGGAGCMKWCTLQRYNDVIAMQGTGRVRSGGQALHYTMVWFRSGDYGTV